MRLRSVPVLLALPLLVAAAASFGAATLAPAATKPAAKGAGVLERPVLFRVKNVNESKLACGTDGGEYNVRGRLVGTAAELRGPRAATLYLHGLGLGEFFWRYTLVPGYNFAEALAKNGHVSVVIDRLGYDASGHPQGAGSCIGGQATIAHQIIGDLKSGNYNGSLHPKFAKLGLIGHSAGGLITEVEAYSFGDAAAIGVLAYADQGPSALQLKEGADAAAICAAGGEPANEVTGPGGYAKLGQTHQEAIESFFSSAKPKVIAEALPLLTANPCGDIASYKEAPPTDLANIGSIAVPVLAVQGGEDALFPVPDVKTQSTLYTGSPKVTYVDLPNSGHALTFEADHTKLEAVVAKFLAQNHL